MWQTVSTSRRRSLHCHIRRTEENLLKVAQKYTKAGEAGPKEYKRQKKRKDIKIGRANHFMVGS